MSSELNNAVWDLSPFIKKAMLFGVIASTLVFAPSLYMLEVYDRVINSRSHTTLGMLSILLMGSLALMGMLEWIRSEILLKASISFEEVLSSRIVDAIFVGNLKGIKECNAESMKDFYTVRDFINSPVIPTLLEIPTSLLMLIALFAIHPMLGWFAVVGAILQTGLAWLNQSTSAPVLLEANSKSIAAQTYADGMRRNSAIVEAMGMLKPIHARWAAKHQDFLNLQALASERAAFYQATVRLVQNVVGSMLLGLSAWLMLRDQINGGGYMIFGSILGGRAVSPIVQIVTQWQTIINSRSAYRRLGSLLEKVPLQKIPMPLPAPTGELKVEDLVVYPPGGRAPSIRGVSFELKPGEVLAVIGPSAAGKTSLAKALIGLWPAAAGKVRLNGVDMYSWNKAELGRYVGYLPQNVELLEGTITENIARFGEPNHEDILNAIKLVGVHNFIESLPLAYSTPVGPNGELLSGGERQRIAIARAVYQSPKLIVMDEPDSNLDDDGDSALITAIKTCKSNGSTVIIMTHRPSILNVADAVMILKDGQAVALGPRDQVLARMTSPRGRQLMANPTSTHGSKPRGSMVA